MVYLKYLQIDCLMNYEKLVLSNSFLKLPKDSFCLEIINLVFPQLKKYSFVQKSKWIRKKKHRITRFYIFDFFNDN